MVGRDSETELVLIMLSMIRKRERLRMLTAAHEWMENARAGEEEAYKFTTKFSTTDVAAYVI